MQPKGKGSHQDLLYRPWLGIGNTWGRVCTWRETIRGEGERHTQINKALDSWEKYYGLRTSTFTVYQQRLCFTQFASSPTSSKTSTDFNSMFWWSILGKKASSISIGDANWLSWIVIFKNPGRDGWCWWIFFRRDVAYDCRVSEIITARVGSTEKKTTFKSTSKALMCSLVKLVLFISQLDTTQKSLRLPIT